MKKKIFGILVGMLMLVGAAGATVALPNEAYAEGESSGGNCRQVKFFGMDPWYAGLTCESDGKTIAQSNFSKEKLGGTVAKIVGVVVKDLTFLVGLAAMIMIIVGGIQYTTSAGNPSAVGKAQKTLHGAIIGLVISVLAYAIVTFIFKVMGV